MKIEKIGNRNVVFKHRIDDWDLNIHLILGEKYNYIIDTGLGSLSVAPIKEYVKNNKKPIIIINTHYHWDHIWGNSEFYDCTIVSQRLCRDFIAENWDEMKKKNGSHIIGEANMTLPNLVFEEMLYYPDDQIRMFYSPGHTIDSISVLDEVDGVINIGDNIGDTLDDIIPSIETTKNVYQKTILNYKTLNIKTCVSGHNQTFGKNVFDKILNQLMMSK